jgi:ubiquinone biosynthesis protein
VGQGQPGPGLAGGAGPPGAGQPGPAAAPHPRQLDRIATIIQRGDLQARARLLADADDVRTVTRLLNRVVLAGLGGLVGVLSVMLLGTQGGPPFTGDTSLFQFFGYFGLFCATVLILRVIVAILRDGLN